MDDLDKKRDKSVCQKANDIRKGRVKVVPPDQLQ